ncbi:MAG: hypothetical protein HYV07_31860 [Deltaproteobacteria bacterium]|nr:hypothetical protein [Deltaproteobacteria bacterium]
MPRLTVETVETVVDSLGEALADLVDWATKAALKVLLAAAVAAYALLWWWPRTAAEDLARQRPGLVTFTAGFLPMACVLNNAARRSEELKPVLRLVKRRLEDPDRSWARELADLKSANEGLDALVSYRLLKKYLARLAVLASRLNSYDEPSDEVKSSLVSLLEAANASPWNVDIEGILRAAESLNHASYAWGASVEDVNVVVVALGAVLYARVALDSSQNTEDQLITNLAINQLALLISPFEELAMRSPEYAAAPTSGCLRGDRWMMPVLRDLDASIFALKALSLDE